MADTTDNTAQQPELTPEEQTNQAMIDSGIGQVEFRTIETEMEKSYLDYSMSVIVSRALPDVRDGLKPVHRRILYVMNNLGLRHGSKFRKSATVVGDVMGSYHPHGDTAIYDAMARMAQDFSMRYMLVDGQGNFGSIDGDMPAAMRYTEARMQKLTEELLVDIDKDTVDFQPNYDGNKREPSVLPAKLPNLLLNGVQGIAVGMATNIPPHNLTEIVDAVIHIIDNPEATVVDLIGIVTGPDFPGGGIIFDDGGIAQAYGTGKGSIVMRADAEIEEDKKGRQRIVITSIPFQVNKSTLVSKIAELYHEKKLNGISGVQDESSDRVGVRIIIDLKKDAYAQKLLNQLFRLTPLQTTFHVNMLALVDGIQPRVLNLEMVLRHYLDHRKVVVRRRTEFELKKAQARAHILEGLRIALDQIDKVISTIRASSTKEEALTNLIQNFKLTEIQAKAILDMQLRTLAGLERKKIEGEYNALMALIKELETILSDEANILKVIREELVELKEKHGDKRRTKVVKSAIGKFSDEDLIPNEEVIITLTTGNYIKRMPSSTYTAQARGGKGKIGMATKEEDVVEHMVQTNNHDTILFFTSLGRAFKLKAHEVPASSRTAKGQAIVNLLNLSPDERVTSLLTLEKDNTAKFLFMTTKCGVIKKTAIAEYQNVRTSGLIAIKLDKGDELKWVKKTHGQDDIIISTAMAQAIRFKESDARPMGRATRGVRGIRLRTGDSVVGMDVLSSDSMMLVVMENGYGKVTKTAQFTPHNRGGVGIKAGVVSTKTGKVVDVQVLESVDQDVLIISKQGQVIRLNADKIPVISRATQGVRIMRLAEKDTVASVTLLPTGTLPEAVEGDTPAKQVVPATTPPQQD